MLDVALLELADVVEFRKDAARRVAARADRRILREIEQHRSEHVTLVMERHAADEVRGVFPVGKHLGRLAACPSRGEDVNGRSPHATVHECVGVDGHEEIGVRFASAPDAIAERHEVVARARQHGLHARLGS